MDSVVQRLESRMTRECSLLSEFHDAETTMKARVHQKDWDGLASVIEEMQRLADDLVETENARHEAFEELKRRFGEPEEATFYQVVVHLPTEERQVLADLYRMMKFSVFGMQAVTFCMDEHVRTVNDTLHEILGELYPHRKGSLYTPRGHRIQSGSNPLLIDQEL